MAAVSTYLETAKIKCFYVNQNDLNDGGVRGNNPALCEYADTRKINFFQNIE